jgi:NAD-dependent SIR2 family protein deacetylase
MEKEQETGSPENNKKYLLIRNGYSVSYDDTACFENDKRYNEKQESKEIPEESKEKFYKKIAEGLKKKFYDEFLKKHYENLVILTGAGTSLDNGSNKAECGKARSELWNECKDEINALESKISVFKEKPFYKDKDIEGCLSHILLYEKLNKTNNNKESLREPLEKKIATSCNLNLQNDAPHKNFISKVISRKPSDTRVKLFTTNYDTLFEQAANNAGIVLIDGFSFSQPRQFSGKWFDLDIVNRERTRLKEESFIQDVLHLYKLHGSLNWQKKGDKIIQQSDSDIKINQNSLIIYPSNEKYESSYEQPYFEMMSRFQQALRQLNTLLIVIGFSFQDKHIKNVILEAVEQNPSFQLLIVNFNGGKQIIDTEALKDFFDNKEIKRRVNIVFDSFSDFTKNYPENETYGKNKEVINE